ncbi:MAG: hypothetical protein AAF517_00240 [Planctomycetota bacterium]
MVTLRNLNNAQPVSRRMRSYLRALLATMAVLVSVSSASAQDESTYYKMLRFPVPDGMTLECGGFEFTEKGDLMVATRHGDVYTVSGAFSDPPKPEYKLYASGLHEVLGLSEYKGKIYATQRGEITRMSDLDGDGRADLFETVSDDWGLSADYHEYAFGSKFDKEGNMWIVLCLTGSFSSQVPFRGWCVRVSHDGKFMPTTSGIRSPGGIGMNHLGDVFYTDNQGPWNGTSGLKPLEPGTFVGHPGGNRWYSLTDLQKTPDPKSGSRFHIEAKRLPLYRPAAILFPYRKMGQSASGVACDMSGGKFGPFNTQVFVSDQTHSTVMRVFLEKVGGRYQGALFPFRKGFGSGNVPMMFAKDGSLFVGGTDRGWGARGGNRFALDRLVWTGKTPFEIHEMRAKPDGFELTFTKPVDAKTAGDLASYGMKAYTYIFQSNYGSPEVDHSTPKVVAATPGADGKSVRVKVEGLREGHIHELHVKGLRSKGGESVLHPVGYYTLNLIPKK